MSEIEADLRRAASAYWTEIAKKGATERTAALLKARQALRDARAQAIIPESAKQQIINTVEAPEQEVVRAHRRRR
jgi:hypothetical protein